MLNDSSLGDTLATGTATSAKGELGSVEYRNATESEQNIFIGDMGGVKPVFIGIAVTNEAPSSATVKEPTGYAGTFTLTKGDDVTTAATGSIAGLVADDVVNVTYEGLDYEIDTFLHTVTADDVTNGSVTLTVPEANLHQLSYVVSGSVTGGTPAGTLTVGGQVVTVTDGTYSTTVKYSGGNAIAYSGDDYNVSPDSFTFSKATPNGDYTYTISQDITLTEKAATSTMTAKFDYSFSRAVTKDEDLGNGVFPVDTMTYTEDSSFSNRSGYITNSDNPADSSGTTSGSLVYPVKGAALKFVVEKDGILSVDYWVNASKPMYIKSFLTSDNSAVNTDSYTSGSTASIDTKTFSVKAGYTYYFYGQGTKARYYGVSFIPDVAAEVTFSTTGDDLSGATITATDNATGGAIQLKTDGTATTVNVGHTYTLSCSDSNLEVKISDSDVFTVEEGATSYSIVVTKRAFETLSGSITNDLGATGFVTSLTFTNTSTNAEYDADVTGDTYTVSVPVGDYTTSAVTTNGMTTSNRVAVPVGGKTDEEVYFVAGGFKTTTYDATALNALVESSDSMLTLTDFTKHDGGHGPYSYNGTISVDVPQKATIKVTVSYQGNFTISGNGTTVSAATTSNVTTATATYTAPYAETATVTINELSYVKEIVITPINEVDFRSSISVPGDYPTITSAINAINNMSSRPSGEDGRVTINLTADVTEQVHVDASYVTINGNSHTIDWYYSLVCSYYSVDSNGFYNEELARDKYSKTATNAYYWGGVVIVDASNFYAKDVTIKNTFNYEVTDKEIADGAEFNSNTPSNYGASAGDLRTSSIVATNYDQKERANALALTGNSECAEFYNVSILSSQDTLGYNGVHSAKAYFKNCTIGGNVDFICGAGNMIFDNCNLELLGYSDKAGTGYITAAKSGQKYLFRNCTITVLEYGYAATTYYGRPWVSAKDAEAGKTEAATIDVKFINTKTNNRVVAAGWGNWTNSGVTVATGDQTTNCLEYMNRATDGTLVVSSVGSKECALSDDAYLAISDSDYLGDWTPVNYIKGVVDVNSNVIVDKDGNIIVYGEIPTTAVDSNDFAGFSLSTITELFDQEIITSDTVYSSVKYTDKDGVEKTIEPSSADNYIVAVVIEGASGSGNIYARGINGIDANAPVYNDFVTAPFEVAVSE